MPTSGQKNAELLTRWETGAELTKAEMTALANYAERVWGKIDETNNETALAHARSGGLATAERRRESILSRLFYRGGRKETF